MKVINQKKAPFAGKTWIRDIHIAHLRKGGSIKIIHKGKDAGHMIITPDDLPTLEKYKSKQEHISKFNGERYHLYGIWWKPVEQQGQKLKKKRTVREVDNQTTLFN